MNTKFASFSRLMAVLVILGLAVIGTYAVRSALHRITPTVVTAHTGEIVAVAFAAAPPLQAPKQASNAIPDRVYWGAAHNHTVACPISCTSWRRTREKPLTTLPSDTWRVETSH
ncbi:MAG: hypothetical protein WBM04_07415 [Candidatus Korobacteraceae bacterium]